MSSAAGLHIGQSGTVSGSVTGVCTYCSSPLLSDGRCPSCDRTQPRSWLPPVAVVVGLVGLLVVGAFLFYAFAFWYVSP